MNAGTLPAIAHSVSFVPITHIYPLSMGPTSSKSLHGAPRIMVEAAEIPAAPVNSPVLTVLLSALYIPPGGVSCSPPF